MFVSPAFAQGLAAGPGGDMFSSILPLILIFAVFYFLLIRPQQKRAKEHKASLDAIRRGDKVVMGGGIIGTVTKVTSNTELMVEIAEGVRVRVQRAMVAGVVTKGQPAEGEEAKPAEGQAQNSEAASGGWKGLFGGKK
jgi:preprotein translocase subunit YajC